MRIMTMGQGAGETLSHAGTDFSAVDTETRIREGDCN
jgi:hypothetical protein